MVTSASWSAAAKKAVATRRARQAGAAKRKTTKGALIKGMTKQLPSDILANPIFRKKLQELMRGYAGIYALYHHDKPY